MMIRPECLKVLAAHRTNEIAVANFRTAFEWIALSPGDLNFTFVRPMGQTPSYGLGLALAAPERRVWVLDGDGSLLMNLGSLVTIANVAPRNLIHFVCNNAMYETSGGQATPGCARASFAGLAQAAGYPVAREFDDLAKFEKALPDLLSAEGPVFVDLKVVPGPEIPAEDWAFLYGRARQKAFRQAMKT